jgi:predicted N-acetyltransferase YhbS
VSIARAPHRIDREGVEYVVRPYGDGDREGFLAVYEASSGFHLGPEWFDATYVDVPYLDHVPVFVVETGGEVVGVRPYTPVRVRGGDGTALALLSRDTIVHPDHRRRGLFTAATEYSLEQYAGSEVEFVFSHSNADSRPGYRKMGWRYPSRRVTHYRPRDATAFVAGRLGPRRRPAALLPGLAMDGYVAVRDALRRGDRSRFDVAVTDGPDYDPLVELHDRAAGRPAGVHPVFDGTALRYHLGNPEYRPLRTYVARERDEAVAAVAVHPRRFHGTDWLSVVHVAPLDGDRRWRRALATLLAAVVRDVPTADAYRVGVPLPARVLSSLGFLSDRHPPMSALESPRLKLGVRPLGDGWHVGGASLLEADHLWALAA